MPMKPHEVADGLEVARALVERGWVTWEDALDADGVGCDPTDDAAVEWSAYGAILVAAQLWGSDGNGAARLWMLDAVMEHLPTRWSLSAWNDAPGRTQAEVIALFDRAIAAAKKARVS